MTCKLKNVKEKSKLGLDEKRNLSLDFIEGHLGDKRKVEVTPGWRVSNILVST